MAVMKSLEFFHFRSFGKAICNKIHIKHHTVKTLFYSYNKLVDMMKVVGLVIVVSLRERWLVSGSSCALGAEDRTITAVNRRPPCGLHHTTYHRTRPSCHHLLCVGRFSALQEHSAVTIFLSLATHIHIVFVS